MVIPSFLPEEDNNVDSLYLSLAGVIDWNNGDVIITHSSNTLTMTGGGWVTTVGAAVNKVGLTVNQNDTTNNPRGVSLVNTGTAATLFIDANGNTSVSTSVGGAVLIENTGNLGSALVIYSNAGASTSGARLLSLRADNTAFDQAVMAISNDGTGAGLSINGTGGVGIGITVSSAGTGTNHTAGFNYTGTSTTAAAGSFTSTNANFTCLQVSGEETGHGTIKVTHTGTGTDANAACLSLDVAGSGTAAQGIFIDATTAGGTTGKLLNLRNDGTEYFTLTAGGKVGIGRATPTGKLDIAGALTVASAAGAVLDDVALQASTITISGSTNITTATGFNMVTIGRPTYTAASAVAITVGATVYIANSPNVGGSATLTDGYSLWVDDGVSRFDGNISMNGSFVLSSTTASITASTTQTQGQGALTTEVNEVSVCANANDTVTLPTAAAGKRCVVINNGAQTLRIFPASGDNLGAGVDTATTLASGSNVVYQAYNDTNWESI